METYLRIIRNVRLEYVVPLSSYSGMDVAGATKWEREKTESGVIEEMTDVDSLDDGAMTIDSTIHVFKKRK